MADQLSIFEPGTVALARGSDPGTSHEAAAAVRVTELQQRVLDILRVIGPSTTERIGEFAGLPRDSVSPRMKPLAKAGLVRPRGHGKNRGGKRAIIWEAVP